MCVSEYIQSLYSGFYTEKTIRIFLVVFVIIPKELISFESASGVQSEYPVNPIQPQVISAVRLRERAEPQRSR